MIPCEPEPYFSLFYMELNTQYWNFSQFGNNYCKIYLVKLCLLEKVSSLAVKSRA